VAPWSTIDLSTRDGDAIPIEERNAREVTHVGNNQLAPEGAHVRNPSFDVTPAKYITAIITERGVYRAPFEESLISEIRDPRSEIVHARPGD
jgi:methylthioribose-1-phosphate isomerase